MFYFIIFQIIGYKGFLNTFKFSNNDINKLILFLRKDVCPYEYMDNWGKFNETLLSEKKNDFKMKNLVEYDTAFS